MVSVMPCQRGTIGWAEATAMTHTITPPPSRTDRNHPSGLFLASPIANAYAQISRVILLPELPKTPVSISRDDFVHTRNKASNWNQRHQWYKLKELKCVCANVHFGISFKSEPWTILSKSTSGDDRQTQPVLVFRYRCV